MFKSVREEERLISTALALSSLRKANYDPYKAISILREQAEKIKTAQTDDLASQFARKATLKHLGKAEALINRMISYVKERDQTVRTVYLEDLKSEFKGKVRDLKHTLKMIEGAINGLTRWLG